MATIGNFQLAGEEFNGEIVTLSLQAKKVRIVPNTRASGENALSHRVLVVESKSVPAGPNSPTRAAWASSSTIRASPPQSTPTSSPTKSARATV